jgi:hypothetical protein
MTKNLKKYKAEKKLHFPDHKLQCTYPVDSKAIEEAFSPPKRTASTSNMKFLNFFLFLWVFFAILDPDPDADPLT